MCVRVCVGGGGAGSEHYADLARYFSQVHERKTAQYNI